jgi:hypothetical protein
MNANNEKFASKEQDEKFFKAPDGYFEDFPGRVMQRIQAERPPRGILTSIRRYSTVYAAAATLLLLITIGTLFLIRNNGSDPVNGFEIAQAEIVDYLLEVNVSEELLVEMLSQGGEPLPETYEVVPDSNVSEDDILDYLLESGVDETDLYNL